MNNNAETLNAGNKIPKNVPFSQLSEIFLDSIALFLDVDGTISPIAPTPDEAVIEPDTLAILNFLQAEGVPVALISGRSLTSIDALTFPYRFVAAGQHGLEIRDTDKITVTPSDEMLRIFKECVSGVEKELSQYKNFYIEKKGLSVAVHYRQAPELEETIKQILSAFARQHPYIMMQYGKMVVELRLIGGNKGTAIEHFMQSIPFSGKTPVYVGDDITDEDGFAVTNAAGGITIKVGLGPSLANYRMGEPQDVAQWLKNLQITIKRKKG